MRGIDPLKISDYWHRRLAGRMTSDSGDLLHEDRVGRELSLTEARELAAGIRRSFGGRVFSDSAELIRATRDA